MKFLWSIRRRHFPLLPNLTKPRSDFDFPIAKDLSVFSSFSSIFWRPLSLSPPIDEENSSKPKESLSDFYRNINVPVETGTAYKKETLERLEKVVRIQEKSGIKLVTAKVDPASLALNCGHGNRTKSLHPTDFGSEDPTVYKKLSPDMQMLAEHLYDEGYFKDPCFLPKHKFDTTMFEMSFAREYLRYAAVKFGKNHENVAQWLSASDLKKVALFGCPSLGQKSVLSAKHMRKYFHIEEFPVCENCKLNTSCSFAFRENRKVVTNLHLGNVMRVLTMYGLGSVPKSLSVPEEVMASVSRLLKEIVDLSKTVP